MFSSYFFSFCLAIIPFTFYLLVSIKRSKRYKVGDISLLTCVILVIIMGVLMGLTPVEEGADKYNYMMEFLGMYEERTSEPAWMLYNYVCKQLFGSVFVFFFIFTSLLYSFLYFYIASKLFPKSAIGYFLILTFGALGFAGYGSNTIRAGISIVLFLYAICVPTKNWIRLVIILFSLLTHKATIIPICAYFVTYLFNKRKVWELFWLLCLLLSVINVDLSSLFEKVGFVDDRVDRYADSIGGTNDYGSQFRYDFLIYSLVPILISNIWMNRYKYINAFYTHVYRMYLFSNAIWLLAIRIAFSDRLAYLSWFLMPLLVLYPILSNGVRIRNAQRYVAFLMGIFIGLNVFLTILK